MTDKQFKLFMEAMYDIGNQLKAISDDLRLMTLPATERYDIKRNCRFFEEEDTVLLPTEPPTEVKPSVHKKKNSKQ